MRCSDTLTCRGFLAAGVPFKLGYTSKSPELNVLLGGSTASDGRAIASDAVYLYDRTSSDLLISKDQNSDQLLIQVSMDENMCSRGSNRAPSHTRGDRTDDNAGERLCSGPDSRNKS